jgi:hypothetical protein
MRLLRSLAILLTVPVCVAVAQKQGKSPFGIVPLLGAPPAAVSGPLNTAAQIPPFSASALHRDGDDPFQLHLEPPYLDAGRVTEGQRLPGFSTIPDVRGILSLLAQRMMARGIPPSPANRSLCYAMRNYQVEQDHPESDATHLKDYSTCQAAGQFQTKVVAGPLVLVPR